MYFELGDKVRVMNKNLRSHGLTGEVVSRSRFFGEYSVRLDGVTNAPTRRYIGSSLEKINPKKSQQAKQEVVTGEERIAVFFTCCKEGFVNGTLEYGDFLMINATSVQDALDRMTEQDFGGTGFELAYQSLLFDGKMYNINGVKTFEYRICEDDS